MAAVCPACGVPVVPGYVRCPKCHKPLPAARKQSSTRDPGGGTAMEDGGGGVPVVAIVTGVAVIAGIILIVALRGRGGGTKPPEVVPAQAVEPVDNGQAPVTPSADPTESAPRAPDPTQAGVNLEVALRRKRLWSTVEVTSGRVEIRSSSCADPGFGPVIDGERPALHGAGLTKLRCVEESGHVAFERDL